MAQVRAAFARYVAAVAARDGAAAVGLVTPASLAHQERLRDLALVAPREQLAALPSADRLMVLRLRHEFTAEELRPLSGADLIRIGVEEAWSSPKVLAPLAITAVEETGDPATARVERAGEPVPIRLLFRRDAGRWRLDLVELARGSDAALCRDARLPRRPRQGPGRGGPALGDRGHLGASGGQGPVGAVGAGVGIGSATTGRRFAPTRAARARPSWPGAPRTAHAVAA